MKIAVQNILNCVPYAATKLIGSIVANWDLCENRGIVTPRQTAFFLGHAAVETAGFTRLDENLFYTTAAVLCRTWPSRFPSEASAAPYLRNPRMLANKVYGGRLGNERDGVSDDDGWDFRGSGVFQTTGYDNFLEVERETGIPFTKEPDKLRQMPYALHAAAIFWQNRNLNAYAERNDVEGSTRVINGGQHGLADRRLYIGRFMSAFAPVGSAVLKRGMRGPAVHKLQERLKALGFYGGALDGDFGPGTFNAVKALQEARGLVPADGVVGPATNAEVWRDEAT